MIAKHKTAETKVFSLETKKKLTKSYANSVTISKPSEYAEKWKNGLDFGGEGESQEIQYYVCVKCL